MLKDYISLTDPQEYQLVGAALKTPWPYILMVLAWVHIVYIYQPMVLLVLAALLIPAALIDMKHMILPDILTISALVLGIIFAPISLPASLIGALVGGIFFALLEIVMTKTLGRPALGWGDVKLLAAIGAWGGVLVLPVTLLIASVIAVHFMLYRRMKHNIKNAPFPFGPFLIIGCWLALFYGF